MRLDEAQEAVYFEWLGRAMMIVLGMLFVLAGYGLVRLWEAWI